MFTLDHAIWYHSVQVEWFKRSLQYLISGPLGFLNNFQKLFMFQMTSGISNTAETAEQIQEKENDRSDNNVQ